MLILFMENLTQLFSLIVSIFLNFIFEKSYFWKEMKLFKDKYNNIILNFPLWLGTKKKVDIKPYFFQSKYLFI